MVEHFQYVLDNYDNGEKKVNSSSKLYDELINKIPQELNQLLQRNDFKIKAFMVLGLDPIEIMNKKMDKTEKKYPVDKAKGNSTKYDKL